MTKINYENVKKKVMASTSSREILSLLRQYRRDEYDNLLLAPLSNHLYACSFREAVLKSYGIELKWAE